MSNYTISTGDNLWNIVSQQYGSKLKNNSQIQQAVNSVVKSNNITNPNVIHADTTINLPSYDSIFTTSKTTSTNKTSTSDYRANYKAFDTWMENQYGNAVSGKKTSGFYIAKSSNSTNTITMDEYMKGVFGLADSNIKASDSDGDNAISYDEYYSQELSGYDNIFGESVELDDDTKALLDYGFNMMDVNQDSKIDSHEISAYYMALDAMDGKGMDGIIQFGYDLGSEGFGDSYKQAFNTLTSYKNRTV